MPASNAVNSAKSDAIPSAERLLDSRRAIFEHWRFWEGSTHARFVAEAETALTRTALPSRGWEGALFDALLETADMAARQLQSRRW